MEEIRNIKLSELKKVSAELQQLKSAFDSSATARMIPYMNEYTPYELVTSDQSQIANSDWYRTVVEINLSTEYSAFFLFNKNEQIFAKKY